MPVIKRNVSAPSQFAGRASSPTMRISGATAKAQQDVINAEFDVARMAVNVGTAVASGFKAGSSGQTTEDLASIAQSGKMADGSDVKDAGDFNLGKFGEEVVGSLGGVKGLMEGGIERQNVAANIVNNYQKGVQIGNAHAKQQGEIAITNGSTAAENSYNADAAAGNYDGIVERAYNAQVSSLRKVMDDPNTTPLVKQNISQFLSNGQAMAAFRSKYETKAVNAVAKKNADKDNADMNAAVKRGDTELVNDLIATQQSVVRTPEQIEVLQKDALYNNRKNNILGSTSRAQTEIAMDAVKADDSLTNVEKKYFSNLSRQQNNDIKANMLESLAKKRDDIGFEELCQRQLELGNFKSPKEMNNFIKNQKQGVFKPMDKNVIGEFNVALETAQTSEDFEDTINQIAIYKDTHMLSEYDKIQIDNTMAKAKQHLKLKQTEIGTEMEQFMSQVIDVDNEDLREEYGIPEIDESEIKVYKEDAFLWWDKEVKGSTAKRERVFATGLASLKAETQLIANNQEEQKAKDHFTNGYAELIKERNTPMYQREFQQIYSPNLSPQKRSFGTPKQVKELDVAGVKSDLKKVSKIKTAKDLREKRKIEKAKLDTEITTINPLTGRSF